MYTIVSEFYKFVLESFSRISSRHSSLSSDIFNLVFLTWRKCHFTFATQFVKRQIHDNSAFLVSKFVLSFVTQTQPAGHHIFSSLEHCRLRSPRSDVDENNKRAQCIVVRHGSLFPFIFETRLIDKQYGCVARTARLTVRP